MTGRSTIAVLGRLLPRLPHWVVRFQLCRMRAAPIAALPSGPSFSKKGFVYVHP